MEFIMDKKPLISFSDMQHQAIGEAANKLGLSFTAFVRMASIEQAVKSGVEISPPRVD